MLSLKGNISNYNDFGYLPLDKLHGSGKRIKMCDDD